MNLPFRRIKRVLVFLPFVCLFGALILTYKLYDWNADIEWSGWPHSTASPSHLLCVLIPFRDRDSELAQFAPYMHDFLSRQGIPHTFFVLNQTDHYRFNRAALINVGWFESDRTGCDYIVMHDVDLLPSNPSLNYSYPGEGIVRHISSPEYHPKYKYANFIGGILMLTLRDYKKVNGMSNKYFGWGLEDDEFFLRIRDAGLKIDRPRNLTTDRETTFKHVHGAERKRDYTKRMAAAEKAEKRKRDRMGGLSNARYRITRRTSQTFGSTVVRILDIEIECDVKKYPFCRA